MHRRNVAMDDAMLPILYWVTPSWMWLKMNLVSRSMDFW